VGDKELLLKIDEALRGVEEAGGDLLPQTSSIKRQLAWCRDYLSGGVPPFEMPGPFSMGLIAVREFDMYGHRPELATLINEIEDEMNERLPGGAA
jgi:hypothetical protein